MRRPRTAEMVALVVAGAAVTWLLFVALPRWTAPRPAEPAPAATADPAASPKIHARLFYVSPSGVRLVAVEREVDFGESPTEQARRLIEAQLAPPPDGHLSAVPAETKLRNLYLADGGIAYVDVTRDITSGHPGGSLAEILTVYSLVSALTENLPAVTSVQILIDGREADTLAGHVDLRRPLQRSAQWIEGEPASEPPAGDGR